MFSLFGSFCTKHEAINSPFWDFFGVWCGFDITWTSQSFSDSEIVVCVCVCVCVDSGLLGNLQNISSAARLPFPLMSFLHVLAFYWLGQILCRALFLRGGWSFYGVVFMALAR